MTDLGICKWQMLCCHIEYCPDRIAVLLYSTGSVLLQALEHFGSGRLAPCLPPCTARAVKIYSPTSLLFLHWYH